MRILAAGCAPLVAVSFAQRAACQISPNRGSPEAASSAGGSAVVASDITPPRLRSSAEPSYPATAHGDAVVVLELTVATDGSVTTARAVEGPEPFASAAVEAASAFRFEPARRAKKPIVARIRVEVRYVEPVAAPAAPPNESQPAPNAEPEVEAATPSAPNATAIPEVTVVAQRKPRPPPTTLGRAEVRQLPGAFGDPFRAIEALPGVTPIVSGLPFFYVRGAPPGNLGYFIDGVRVPYLFHIGFGPSVIHPGLVERVELYPGAYPAEFGHYTGGIVSAETTDPRRELHGEYNVRLFDLGALAETGFADGRGTALAGFRYSYTAALLSLLQEDVTLDYRDYEARVSYDLTPDDRLTLFSFGSYDLLGRPQNNSLEILFGQEFYRTDIRYDHRFSRDTTVRTAVTLGWDQTRIPDQPRNARRTLGGARIQVSHAASKTTLVRGGADVLLEHYQAQDFPNSDPDDPNVKRFNAMFPPRDDLTLGGFTDVLLRTDDVEVIPGIRADLYRSATASAVGVDPRIRSRIRVSDSVHVLHTFGVAHQPPSYVLPLPGLAVGELKGGLQTSLQSSAGVEVELAPATTATLAAFENIFLHMSDTLSLIRPGENDSDFTRHQERSLGASYGMEVYLRRKLTKRFGGYVSYTLSRSDRRVGRETFPSSFDRTHVASAAIAYDLGRHWLAGARFVFYTGAPKIPNTKGLIPPPRSEHPEREANFYRLDLRLEKRWKLTEKAWIAFVAELMNATFGTETVLGEEIGPITIPSIGVEGAF